MSYTAQPVGFLADFMQRVRDLLKEPSGATRWTNDRIWPHLIDGWQIMMNDVNSMGDNRIIVHLSIDVDPNTTRYMLPANVGRVLRLGSPDSASNLNNEVLAPRSYCNPWGSGYRLEGNSIIFEPSWNSTETLQLDYIPNGYCAVHVGTVNFADAGSSSTVVNMDYDPAEGYYDRTPAAYLGCVFTVLDAEETDAPSDYVYFPMQSRIITAFSDQYGRATLSPGLDPDLTEEPMGQCTYEVVPFLANEFKGALAWRVAGMIAGIQWADEPKRSAIYLTEYARQLRGLRLRLANMDGRSGNRFYGDVPGNGRFGWSIG